MSAPSYVQIVDWEIINTGIKPFTIYTIVSRVGEGGELTHLHPGLLLISSESISIANILEILW